MANISRHETAQLLEKFKTKYIPMDKLTPGQVHVLSRGVRLIARELTSSTGAASPRLRNFARVLKHFLETHRGEDAIHYFNHIIQRVDQGIDPTSAIKRCRSTMDLPKTLAKFKQDVRAFEEDHLDAAVTSGGPEYQNNWVSQPTA